MATPPKKSAPKAPPPLFARKLLTAWRNAAARASNGHHANLSKLTSEPGVWEALAASIDSDDVPITNVWRLGNDALDHLPARYAVDLMRAQLDAEARSGRVLSPTASDCAKSGTCSAMPFPSRAPAVASPSRSVAARLAASASAR